ncbi:hypothetical protein QR680_006953 [Steinernema hermaphroditum]|uniref:C-type lectin domain-containing protein n=1 Tax=Steinernema hermaphroditum TaxID=289476 RepID=A0AA39HX34_9BILA|nr:hypothetical protein QR680_006953 [Steinernema hermaphroditum]
MKLLLFTVSIVVLLEVAFAQHPCQEGWKHFNQTGFCYRAFEEKKDWFKAKMFCRSLGGYLVSIHSKAENEWIVEQFKQGHYADHLNQTWIGLSAPMYNGMYIWEDLTRFDYDGWAEDEPTCTEKNCEENEYCAQIMTDECDGCDVPFWNDMWCWFEMRFICKKKPV